MAKGSNTAAAVRELAEPFAKELGLSIWDVRFLKEGSQWYLRIFIDKPGGVSIDDCVNMTHAINGPLDEADPIEQAYLLEVSSPGVERELTRPEHFQSSIGKKVKIKTIRPIDAKRDFNGVLTQCGDKSVTLECGDGQKLEIAKKDAAWIKLDDFDMADE